MIDVGTFLVVNMPKKSVHVESQHASLEKSQMTQNEYISIIYEQLDQKIFSNFYRGAHIGPRENRVIWLIFWNVKNKKTPLIDLKRLA